MTTRGGDRLAFAALLGGIAVALVNWRMPSLLVAGVALSAAGAALALRHDRPLIAPRLMPLAGVATLLAVAAHLMIGIVGDWQLGQLLAEGTPIKLVRQRLQHLEQLRIICRALALLTSLLLLLAALVTRSGKQKGPE